MRAIVYRGDGIVEVNDVPAPANPGPGAALIRTSLASICGSDLHILHGHIPGMTPGATIGHEVVGVVEAVGAGVESVAVGDRVVAAFQIACGHCWFCTNRQFNLCEDLRALGYGMLYGDLGGAQAELVDVPSADVNLLKVPHAVTDEQAVFIGDILTTAYAAVIDVQAGDTVAVVGAGPVGRFAAMWASVRGAAQVFVIDMIASRLDGVENGIDAAARNPVTVLAAATGGRGADVVIDAAGGSWRTVESAMNIVRRGGRVEVVGVHAELEMPLPLAESWLRALTLRFSGTANIQAWWHEVMDHVASGRIDPTTVISHRLTLADGVKAYDLFNRREATKIVLRP